MDASDEGRPAKRRKAETDADVKLALIARKLELLSFNDVLSATPDEERNSLLHEYLIGLRPGIGLIGTVEEEAALYAESAQKMKKAREEDQKHAAEIKKGMSKLKQEAQDSSLPAVVAAQSDAPALGTGSLQGQSNDNETDQAEKTDADDAGQVAARQEQPGAVQEARIKTDASATLQEYEPNKEEEEGEEEEELGDYERLGYPHDMVLLRNGTDEDGEDRFEQFHVADYHGPKWDKLIWRLHSVEAMPCSPNMTVTPHDYQLKGASQADYACRGPLKGLLVGDQMGLGKTLLAILAMWLCRKEPGMCLVISPAGLCRQWVESIDRSWQKGHGLRAFHLNDSSITATQLNALGFDIVVCSYEFLEANGRNKTLFPKLIEDFSKAQTDPGSKMAKPKRPTAALESELWPLIGLPWKRVVLDEAHKVNKNDQSRHMAVKRLRAEAFIIMSGTLPHNLWHNFSGYVDFLQNHPYNTRSKFLHTFSSWDYDGQIHTPDMAGIRLLQKFLQGCLIARPRSILSLKGCKKCCLRFPLEPEAAKTVALHTAQYKKASADKARKGRPRINVDDSDVGFLVFAIKAQLMSLHPMLYEECLAGNINTVKNDEDVHEGGHRAGHDEVTSSEKRPAWLKRVQERDHLCTESERLIWLLKLYGWLVQGLPGRKIVIFSKYLMFLDIFDEALSRTSNIKALRFDGSVSQSKRIDVEREFETCDTKIPLLISAGAGGEGLNMAHASIVIQTEPWWNANVEAQAVCRVYRQGQQEEVMYIRLEGLCAIDQEIVSTSCKKARINDVLMRDLLRRHDEKPVPIQLLHDKNYIGDL